MRPLGKATYRGSVLVLDDEENMGKILTRLLNLEGYHVTAFSDSAAALRWLETNSIDVVISDIRMPGLTGREVLDRLAQGGANCVVIMMTAYGTIEGAIDCVKAGAFDYITKPFKTDELLLTLGRAFEHKRLRDTNAALTQALNDRDRGDLSEMIGDSPPIIAVRDLIRRIAPTDSSVLVMGESGTGKELAARALHRLSRRTRGRFVAINCASIPENLMESELFGHEKGAFTGAAGTKVGLVEMADGGTLFLDEIGELALQLQAKLLRVLQEHEITRVGGVTNIPVDIRVVAATNRDLQQSVAGKTFREDLYYRLNVLSVKLPPLRDRPGDIPILAKNFLEKLARKHGRATPWTMAPDLLARLQGLAWPGNIRELQNVMERLAILAEGDVISISGLPTEFRTPSARPVHAAAHPLPSSTDYKTARDSFEREFLVALLRQHAGSVTEAAKAAGISRRSFYEKIEKLSIEVGRQEESG